MDVGRQGQAPDPIHRIPVEILEVALDSNFAQAFFQRVLDETGGKSFTGGGVHHISLFTRFQFHARAHHGLKGTVRKGAQEQGLAQATTGPTQAEPSMANLDIVGHAQGLGGHPGWQLSDGGMGQRSGGSVDHQ